MTHDDTLLTDRIARQFIDAFNRRDADGLVALAHSEIEFHPTPLVGAKRVYVGHDGVRRWMAELVAGGAEHQVRIREIRTLAHERFVVLTEVLLGEEVVAPSAMVAKLAGEEIIEARAYLSDEATLTELDLLR